MSKPTILMKIIGHSSRNHNFHSHDENSVTVDWNAVHERLESHPEEASVPLEKYPLHDSLWIRNSPVPAYIVKGLLDCCPEALDECALHRACGNPNIAGDVVRILLERGTRTMKGTSLRRAGGSTISLSSALNKPEQHDDNEHMPESQKPIYSMEVAFRMKLLHFATMSKSIEAVKVLLDYFPQLLYVRYNTGCLPLNWAFRKNEPRIVSLLMQEWIKQKGPLSAGGLYDDGTTSISTRNRLLHDYGSNAGVDSQNNNPYINGAPTFEAGGFEGPMPIMTILQKIQDDGTEGEELTLAWECLTTALQVAETARINSISQHLHKANETNTIVVDQRTNKENVPVDHETRTRSSEHKIHEFQYQECPILHAAVGRVPLHIHEQILTRYPVSLTATDNQGRTALVKAIILATEPKTNARRRRRRKGEERSHEEGECSSSVQESDSFDYESLLEWKSLFAMFFGNKYDQVNENDDRTKRTTPQEEPPCVTQRDAAGRLPLHIAAERGLEWNNGLEEIVKADFSALTERDPVSRLFPFMLAGCSMTPCGRPSSNTTSSSTLQEQKHTDCDLNAVFSLLLENPEMARYHET